MISAIRKTPIIPKGAPIPEYIQLNFDKVHLPHADRKNVYGCLTCKRCCIKTEDALHSHR